MGVIYQTRETDSSRYPNTEMGVKDKTGSEVFLTKFEMFGDPMKYCVEYLICLLYRKRIRSKQLSKIVKIYVN